MRHPATLCPEPITRVTSNPGEPAAVLGELWTPALFFCALCVGEAVFGRINSAVQLRLAPRQRQYIARALFDYLHGHSHRFFSENFAGALAHRISEVSHGTNQVLWAAITEFWPIAIVISVSTGLLLSENRWLGGFTLLWSVAFVAISIALARRTQPLAQAASSARSRTVGQVVDSASNHAAVRLFSRHDHERHLLDGAYAAELETVLRSNLAMERVRWFQFGASALLKAGTVVSVVLLYSRGSIGVGAFVMAVSLALLIIAQVQNLSRRFLDLFESIGNVDSGVRAILRPHELRDAPGASEHCVADASIEFDAVRFAYGDGHPVFRGLSVAIPSGQRVGLVGLSGSGKSTFVSLLLRLYDIQGGRIRITAVVGYYGVDPSIWAGYYVLDDSPIRSARDFVGKKVSMNTVGAHQEFVLREYLARAGLTKEEITQVMLVVVPPVSAEQSLRQHQVDVAVLGGILRDKALERGHVRSVFSDYDLFGVFTAGSYVLTKDFLRDNPKTARRFVEATARAIEWSRSTPRDQVIARMQSIVSRRGRNEDVSTIKYWHSYGVAGQGGLIHDREFQVWIDWLVKDGQLEPNQLTPAQLYTNELNPFLKGPA